MNYARIYAEFIRDRLAKQPSAPEYFEVHHIKPRCLGGGNEPENLIRLTAEDHLFAHILLAWIHGGKLWGAVFLMKSGDRSASGFSRTINRHHRLVYGIARRRHAENKRGKRGLRGAENGNHNSTLYRWVHLDSGDRRSATLHDMWDEFGGARSIWTSAATPGSGKPSAFGWAIDDGVLRVRSSKGKTFTFVNRDGRVFVGTQGEFCSLHGLSVASGSRVVRRQSVTACGWRLKEVKDRHHFARKRDGKPAQSGTGKVYIISKGGRVVSGPRAHVARAIGSTPAQFSAGAGQIMRGVMRTYKGWQVQWQDMLF